MDNGELEAWHRHEAIAYHRESQRTQNMVGRLREHLREPISAEDMKTLYSRIKEIEYQAVRTEFNIRMCQYNTKMANMFHSGEYVVPTVDMYKNCHNATMVTVCSYE